MPACPAAIYAPGVYTGHLSLPIDYWIEGLLLEDVRLNGRIHLSRYVRQGVVARGLFTSSIICRIDGSSLVTCNSVYQVVKVPFLNRSALELKPKRKSQHWPRKA